MGMAKTTSYFNRVSFNAKLKARAAKLEDRDCLVVPVVMLTVGVHNGSNGPLLYTEEILKTFARAWNHRPIVLEHPSEADGGSAASVEVVNKSKLGVLLNSRYEKGKLIAEAWLDVARTSKIAPAVLSAVKKGETVEVSTGFFGSYELTEGTHNGESYEAVVTSMEPDHLAILSEQKGACSVEDGCGLLKNELSHNELWQALDGAVRSSRGSSVWIIDIFDEFVIYQDGTRYFREAYSVNAEGKVVLSGESMEVVRKIEYRSTDGEVLNLGIKESEIMAEKKNCSCPVTDEESTVNSDEMKQETKTKTKQSPSLTTGNEESKGEKPDAADEAKKSVANESPTKASPAPPTIEEYIANAPSAIREILEDGLVAAKAERKKLIDIISANKANVFTAEQLAEKNLGELRAIAALAKASQTVPQGSHVTANFVGQGDVAEPSPIDEEPLIAPTINFEKAVNKKSA